MFPLIIKRNHAIYKQHHVVLVSISFFCECILLFDITSNYPWYIICHCVSCLTRNTPDLFCSMM